MNKEKVTADANSRILRAQKRFFQTGKTRNLEYRIQMLKRLGSALKKYEIPLKEALAEDLGKPEFESYATEIGFVLADIRYTLKYIRRWTADKSVRTPGYLLPGKSKIRKEPYGSVLIMGPYNYPVQLLLEPLVGAIAAGNCAVLKPSELTPHVSKVLAELIRETYEERYVACIEGGKEVNTDLLSLRFDYIFFTGSARVGRIVMHAAAENLIPVTLELGGKSPVIVERTADVAEAARRIMWGKLINAGQTCVAPDYILVDRSIKDQLLAQLKAATEEMYGKEIKKNPDFGRIVNRRHVRRLERILSDDASYLYYGGEVDEKENYVGPAILDLGEKIDTSAAMREEIFGPILPVLPYDKLSDAINYIERREKPLALYLFTGDKKVEARILDRIQSGGAAVNDTVNHLVNLNLPFGGIGHSGIGKYHGRHSFETFTHARSVFSRPQKWGMTIARPPFHRRKMKLVKIFMK